MDDLGTFVEELQKALVEKNRVNREAQQIVARLRQLYPKARKDLAVGATINTAITWCKFEMERKTHDVKI